MLGEAKRDADAAQARAVLEGKEAVMKLREEWDEEEKRRREDLDRQQERVSERLTLIDRKLNTLDDRDKDVKRREQSVGDKEKHLAEKTAELSATVEEHRNKLEELSGMSGDEAKELLMKQMTDAAESEAAARIRDIREEAKRSADREAKKIISLAVQRLAFQATR
jgi:ribonuclease Y